MKGILNLSMRSRQYLVTSIFATLVLAPILYYGWPSEAARWIAAEAELQYQAGDVASSIATMERAVARAPHNQTLKLELARKWMLHSRADDAMPLIEQVIKASVDPRPALRLKAECLMMLDRKQESLDTLKGLSDYLMPSEYGNHPRQNEMAYFRALAGKELQMAERNIQEAISKLSRELWGPQDRPMRLLDQALLSIGLVALRAELSSKVLPILNTRIERLTDELGVAQQVRSEFIYEILGSEFPLADDETDDIRKLQQATTYLKRDCSYLLSIRALIYQQLGEIERCEFDRLTIIEYGFEPQGLIETQANDWGQLIRMEAAVAYLDTRAMVYLARGQNIADAIFDLDVAVLAVELLADSGTGVLKNSIQDEAGVRFSPMSLARQEAVIRKHRADSLLRRGRQADAEIDFLRIEELGFSRDEPLF